MNCGLHMAFQPQLQRPCGHVRHPDMLTFPAVSGSRHQRCKPARARCQQHSAEKSNKRILTPALPSAAAGLALWLLTEQPAFAQQAATDFSKGSYRIESYWASLGLFLISVPGLWSQIKRAPKAKKRRKTYEVDGPARPGAVPLDNRARQIFEYFKKYNYEVKDTGEVITFAGTYQASKAQAAALVFYTFCGLASTALVLSIAVPFGHEKWYLLVALSPLAGGYYFQRGTRQENFLVKMVTADDDATTDILIEGDEEEAERFRKELNLAEKGKIYVKGLLE